jgi:hypothetical protein
MNIEIVDFFPFPKQIIKNKTCGTMHVYLIDLEIDIRGMYIEFSKNGSLYMRMPGGFGIDHETGQKVRYPIFSFTSQQKGEALMQSIRTKAKEYVQKNLIKAKQEQMPQENLKIKEQSTEVTKIEKSDDLDSDV